MMESKSSIMAKSSSAVIFDCKCIN